MKKFLQNIFAILNRKEKEKLVKLTILDLCTSILDILFLIGILYVINFYTESDTKRSSFFFSDYFNRYPLLLISIFLVLFALKNFIGFLVSKMQYNYVYEVASRISKDNLLHYLHGSYDDYVKIDSSVNMYKISQQPIEFCHYVLSGFQQVFSQAALIGLTIIAILIYNPLLFPLLLIILTAPVILTAWLMKKKLAAVRLHGKTTGERSIQHLQEALAGYIESNIDNKHDFFSTRYHSFQSKLNHYLAEKLVIQHIPSRLIEVFAVFGLFVLILLNTYTANGYTIQLITIGAFMAAAYKVIPGIVKIINIMGQVKTYSYTISGLLDQAPLKDKKNSTDINSIEFNSISFSYHGKKIIESFSMHLSKGDFAGISGPSGKGKTTIANLLLGFLNQDGGNILINGKEHNKEERQGYWNRISYSKQQPFFLHDSILQNIKLHDGAHDTKKLNSILNITGIDKILANNSAGLETIVTENGKNFSGGQRQRIIFARALYKDADLVILDEPFNELDETSEKIMLEQLKKIAAEGKIVILVTHNSAALDFCNKTIILNER